jgi:hypothetical protein
VLLEEIGDLLLGPKCCQYMFRCFVCVHSLDQNLAEVPAEIFVTVVVEGSSLALVTDTRGTADTVDVLGDAIVLSGWQIVVDDVLDVGDIKTTSSDASSDQDGATTGAEGAPGNMLVTRQAEGIR